MSRLLQARRRGILLLALADLPAAGLGPDDRAGLARALQDAATDTGLVGVVLGPAGPAGFADAGLADPDALRPPATRRRRADAEDTPPTLAELAEMIEAMPCPVVLRLAGRVTGGLAELALAADGCIAVEGLSLAFTDTALGLPPAAGATQRLPRRCGARQALDCLLGGATLDAAGAVAAGIADLSVRRGPAATAAHPFHDTVAGLPEAMALAAELAVTPELRPLDRNAGLADPSAYLAEIAQARSALSSGEQGKDTVALRVIDCVEAALILSLEAGLGMERAARADALATPATRALIHVARAEVDPARLRPSGGTASARGEVAVIGVAGVPLVAEALAAGLAVTLVEVDQGGLDTALGALVDGLDAEVLAGRLAAEERDRRLARLAPTTRLERLGAVPLAVEGGETDPDLVRELLRAMAVAAGTDTRCVRIDATGDVDRLAREGAQPALVTLDLPRDIEARGLAGLAAAPGATPDAVAAAAGFARRLGRHVVQGAGVAGRLRLTLSATLARTVERLLLSGATPEAIDASLRAAGWRTGPCLRFDRDGLDRVTAQAAAASAAGWAHPGLGFLETLAEVGQTGRAAGAGLYDWAGGQPGGVTPLVLRAISGGTEAAAPTPDAGEAPPDAAGIRDRIEAALAVAGLRAVASGAAGQAADIDLVAIHGLGLPRISGGPMHAAGQGGLVRLQSRLRALAAEDPELWTPPPLLADLIKTGRTLEGGAA
ncbi:hypothetical protein EKE94_01045 [Mesobaculum littorinae]|uniref:Uncharacterized protein n=1 Tax=Mesobaculum littorinae TaxID=2486419 RepID=A0A438AKZ9_9RHOB|nr:enoyl-CoA hydratase-related protein [Mesobaculum littorinae]RVV99314.1 hypothetical protein EKE94_01045 [Mesobaculum littorinae]